MAFFLRRWAIKTLGVFWSIEIEMRDNHEMVTNGPYKFCRHPNYLAIILEIIGFCLIANAYRLLIFTLIVYIPLLLLRIKAEEVELVKKFSENYIRYIKNTPALLPFNKP
jgi:protein-S-isoprenylcysteine O-methyltransferase Ste14